MQNKLFDLNNEERNRILNLHESRSKQQYLNSLKQDINTLSSKIDDTYFWGVSPDEKIFFTNKNLYVNEGDELKKLEYDIDSLPYILETARKKCDKMLVEGNITLNKYLSIPQKFLMSLMEEWEINNYVKQEINENWNNKFKDSIRLLTENRQLIFENKLNHQLWEEVNLICNQIILEQGWNPFSKDFVGYKAAKAVGSAISQGANWAGDKLKKAGTAAWEGIKQVGNAIKKGGEWVIKGISSAAGKLLNWVLKKGIIPALRWLRRNLNSYIGMIAEIIASMFPTVVVVKAIWCLIVILDIYEILYNDFDPKDPDRGNAPFMGLITDLISLLTTGAVGAGSKAIFKTAAKEAATGKVVSTQVKGWLRTILDSLPGLKNTLKYVQNIVTTWFGKSAGDFLGKVFNSLDGVVTKLGNWISKTFNVGKMGKSVVQTAKQIPTKVGLQKIITGAIIGGGLQYLTGDKILKKGDTNNFVKQAQQLVLQSRSHTPEIKYNGPVNGTFDESLENAIKQIQKLTNLPVTGTIDSKMGMMLGIDYGPGTLEKLTGNIPFANAAIKNISNGFGVALMGATNFIESNLGSFKGALSGNTQNKKA